jgi:hypothetical protein
LEGGAPLHPSYVSGVAKPIAICGDRQLHQVLQQGWLC